MAATSIQDPTHTLVLSYLGIRRAIGICGIVLPLVLGPFGWLVMGIEIQENMSSYYHTALRDVFVGILCAIGIFLFCYRGHDWIETWTANLGCVSAIGIAIFPLDPHSDPLYQRSIVGYLHTFSGGVFFSALALYSLYHFPRTEPDEITSAVEPRRNWIYVTTGIVMLLSLIAMGTYLLLLPAPLKTLLNQYKFLFWMEWVAVWSFAIAWLAKGRALLADVTEILLKHQRQMLATLHGRTSPDS